jgi:hypothetical protein
VHARDFRQLAPFIGGLITITPLLGRFVVSGLPLALIALRIA